MSFLFVFQNFTFAQSHTEQRVNEHLSKTHNRIEIERRKREVDLIKENQNIYLDPSGTPVQREGFQEIYNPQVVSPTPRDWDIQTDAADPQAEIRRQISQEQDQYFENEAAKKRFIEEFKRKARESGIEVEVDPHTLKAHPK